MTASNGEVGMLGRRCGRIGGCTFALAAVVFVAVAGPADSATGWGNAGAMSDARGGHTATLLPTGKVLVTAGTDGPLNPATAEIYDPATNAWARAGTLTGGSRLTHAAALLQDGRVLVMGSSGCSCSAPRASAELYSPVTNSWSAAASMNTGRGGHTATTLPDGKVLVAGGSGSPNSPTAELYDPVSDTWSPTGSMASGRGGHSATLLPNGTVLVVGGADAPAELYDPAAGTWSATGSMTSARNRAGHVAVALSGGRVLVAGGSAGGVLSSTEIYDMSTGTWATVGGMAVGRAGHAGALLPDGTVLVAGGRDGSVYIASTEVFDPTTGAWSAVANLNLARDWHTATALPGGKVLIAGGYARGENISRGTATAERFPEEIRAEPPATGPPVGVVGPTAGVQPAPDTRAPFAALVSDRTQKIAKWVTTTVKCGSGEDCIVSATGKLTVPGAARVYSLTAVKRRTLKGGRSAKLKLAVPNRVRRAASKALHKRRRVRANLIVTVKDAAGNTRTLRDAIRLKR
jgi:hypothetical protein